MFVQRPYRISRVRKSTASNKSKIELKFDVGVHGLKSMFFFKYLEYPDTLFFSFSYIFIERSFMCLDHIMIYLTTLN